MQNLAHDKNKKVGDEMGRARAPNSTKIKKSLILQLDEKGAKVAHFESLIDDYIFLFETKKKLQEDIEERGVAFETTSASGHLITKQNQSVKDLVAVNKQMLMILDKLKLTVDEPTGVNTGENDDL